MVRLYRQENIDALYKAISGDEYEDAPQLEKQISRANSEFRDNVLKFILRNLVDKRFPYALSRTLECGPGSGTFLPEFMATHYLEPSLVMINGLKKKVKSMRFSPIIEQGVMEYIPWEKLDNIVFANGFFQVRSDYEALIEVNRALNDGGRFIFNLRVDDSEDIVCGRVLGFNNYIRVLKEFGFEPVEVRKDEGFICVEKVADFTPKMLRKLQLIEVEKNRYIIKNFYAPRDEKFI